MEKLSVPLSAITETGVIIDVTVDAAQLQPPDAAPVPAHEVRVQGKLQHISDEYLFTGTVSGVFEHPCDRCLEQVVAPFDIPVLWSFRAGGVVEEFLGELAEEDIEAEDFDSVGLEGNEVRLGPQVWEELVLNAPVKFLCSEDCAGLCPHCGVNLNRGACACPKDDVEDTKLEHTGLMALGDMFPDLKPKDPEE